MHRNSREEPFDLLLRQALQQEITEKQQEEQRVLTRTNNLLKAELQRREQCRSISLWFLPGALHALLLGLAGSLAGWTLTGVGVRYFGLKERTTIRWEKR